MALWWNTLSFTIKFILLRKLTLKGYYNDLWRYSESEGWVWIDGSDQLNQPNEYTGNETHPGGRYYSAMWIDKNNALWLFGGAGSGLLFYFNNFI